MMGRGVSALVAYGVGADGKRQLLAMTIGAQESEESWADLLQQLVERGLSGVRLVIADGHAGLWSAVRHHLPEAQHQRCTVHPYRNVQAKVPRRLRGRVARAVVALLHAPSLAEAKKRKRAFEAGLGQQVPEAVACLDATFSLATTSRVTRPRSRCGAFAWTFRIRCTVHRWCSASGRW